MNLTPKVSISVLLCLGLAVLFLQTDRIPGADPKPDGAPGRYQPIKIDNLPDVPPEGFTRHTQTCVLDTATGKVWRLVIDTNRKPPGKWILVADEPK